MNYYRGKHIKLFKRKSESKHLCYPKLSFSIKKMFRMNELFCLPKKLVPSTSQGLGTMVGDWR